MDRGAWYSIVHRVAKSRHDWATSLHFTSLQLLLTDSFFPFSHWLTDFYLLREVFFSLIPTFLLPHIPYIYILLVKWSESEVAQLCPTLSDPMDCSLPGSSIHGIFQATVMEWDAIAFSLVKSTAIITTDYTSLSSELNFVIYFNYNSFQITFLCSLITPTSCFFNHVHTHHYHIINFSMRSVESFSNTSNDPPVASLLWRHPSWKLFWQLQSVLNVLEFHSIAIIMVFCFNITLGAHSILSYIQYPIF